MSRTQLATAQVAYTTKSDAMKRHEQGVSKSKKAALTGGGRAWSEEEESYLLQTRLQKMPYKHIAAHLKKTELACRLHYHQLCHGSNRRKRTASCSSGSDRSPVLPMSAPMSAVERQSRSLSPIHRAGSYGPAMHGGDVHHLPSISGPGASPRLPAILPKPASMHPRAGEPCAPRFPPMMHEQQRTALPPVNFHHQSPPPYQHQHQQHQQQQQHHQQQQQPRHHQHQHQNPHATPPPSLRVDCSNISLPSTSTHTPAHVDLSRLQAVYEAHRHTFWSIISKEYGGTSSPAMLEMAWKTGMCCRQEASRPITPLASPDNDRCIRSAHDKTRISSILTGDEDPIRRRDGGW